jgi:transcriptional regulator with XRE-family HTH domain
MSQEELSSLSGVTMGTIRFFEQKGQISLGNLVKISIALGEEETLLKLFEPDEPRTLFGSVKNPKDRIRATGSRKANRV